MKFQTHIGKIIGIVVGIAFISAGAWYVYTNPILAIKFGLRKVPPSTVSSAMRGMTLGSTTPENSDGMYGELITGSIEILNDNGFILTLQNGNTENVILSATTTIDTYASSTAKPTAITSDQLSVGEQVQVVGLLNSDNSILADTVRAGALPMLSSTHTTHGTTGVAPLPVAE
jgi:hypothetical protein